MGRPCHVRFPSGMSLTDCNQSPIAYAASTTLKPSSFTALGAEMLGIGGDGDHGLGRGGEQDVVNDGLVLIGNVGDGRRQREHHMEVRNRKQVGLARGEPFRGGGALTLRAMPVTAAVVGRRNTSWRGPGCTVG